MDIQAEKLDLISWMIQLSDETMIQKIKALRNEKVKSSKNALQNRSEESQKAIQSGEVIGLQEFKNKNQEWLKEQATK